MHAHPGLHDAVQAREVLGAEHALVRVLEQQDVIRRDLLVLGTLLGVLLAGTALGSGSAAWLAGATGVTLAALGVYAAFLLVRRREAAIALIIEGRARLPLPAVAAEREHLLDPAYRRSLARSLGLLRWRAEEHAEWFRTSPVPYDASMIRTVADGMRELERLLTSDEVGVRGVALTHRLLIDGCSPLHGRDPQLLSEELHRIVTSLRSAG